MNKVLTKIEALSKIKELQAFVEQLESEERWEPEKGNSYWYISSFGTTTLGTWDEHEADARRFELGNCLETEQEAEYHKLRLQSMAERGREPERKVEKVLFYWSFRGKKVFNISLGYDKDYFSNYLIGNIHKTEKDCEKWYQKYGSAFEVLGRGEDE